MPPKGYSPEVVEVRKEGDTAEFSPAFVFLCMEWSVDVHVNSYLHDQSHAVCSRACRCACMCACMCEGERERVRICLPVPCCRESRLVFSSRGVTPLSLLTSTVFFTFVWEATNYVYLRGLTLISSTDVTAIFSSAPAFVYILSIFILREPILVLRVSPLTSCDVMVISLGPFSSCWHLTDVLLRISSHNQSLV